MATAEMTIDIAIDTAAFDRAIALATTDTEPWEYDLALALGYEPKSWDGMYRLEEHPFTIMGSYVLIREIVGKSFSHLNHAGDARIRRIRYVRIPDAFDARLAISHGASNE